MFRDDITVVKLAEVCSLSHSNMDYEKPEAVAPNGFQHSIQQTVEPDVEIQHGFDSTPQKDREERRGDSLWSEP